ncbi:bifunctional tRNA (5-methylaminomethyl-2-thiouridine)(34)-methyltransferase MnmD/FAD-dependent 5-carboxymethylaminomethyl-2-thiouridine(34) oxidoreductase MnmC [Pseudoalteromonas tunicata]|uniref:bifunctional tRNA (5-methylaminomethyl-2-thiouridine)(34)-methyltransferase MnmD/FAD-dependent 5-carboxymethylaminomethyl-2-thiouridine(34) oxidoreductase MnmC n=1 Tax=Pseudoalteromonas tunicata TaxID=314281 RepID=UPI00273FFC80|nr:bifunctional tRNA (5-methylaminomethyl-2-thiouridine)(34)-methyltransferase MnmD/FAD-dependent 5-carboxymethylaminomethyl-2-thiouridine(34) oxidoreductase MnmC [Pseudoalteromonas tunicata]MDP4983112.1 bifunctional tRNA (5-methylaminomethyl-2-thiouridine)(34)-methyltransferase MnmD/FAD-dependent 5-carboxymethylaminomethyl-2-thiouridine(34) oxidoreductase MnmC [Pseudoalteromonas tunicata]
MIDNAPIHLNPQGTPVSDNFGDVYFSNDDGLLESNYVFFTQNNIAERLLNGNAPFVIAETGFGTGLNFLNTWAQFNTIAKTEQTLHFISFEKFPIDKKALSQIHARWPQLKELTDQLVQKYPINLTGCHRLEFLNGRVILDLWFGDVHDSLAQMPYHANGWVDAWYLDGFAPSKNPQMWQQSLFNAMANLAKEHCTFATFTAAGDVRRGLIKAGFDVKKHKGYGKKREMLVGKLASITPKHNQTLYLPRITQQIKKIAIIGGGIAAANMAVALAKKRVPFTIYCKDPAPAMGASHNQQGALYPHIQVDFSNSSEFFAHGFYYARRLYDELNLAGFSFDHSWCGVLLQAVKPSKLEFQQNFLTKNQWPKALIHPLTAEQSTKISGVETPYSGLFIPDGGWINPPSLVKALFAYAQSLQAFECHFNSPVTELIKQNELWQLKINSHLTEPYSQVIIACAEHSNTFHQSNNVPLVPVRGQVSHIKSTPASTTLKTVLCHKGYFTPHYQGQHCMGATFNKGDADTALRASDDEKNLEQFQSFYQSSHFATELNNIESAKAGIRCTVIDHLPLAGQLIDAAAYNVSFAPIKKGQYHSFLSYKPTTKGLYLLTALGARGLCSAPLLAELISCELTGHPLPVSKRVADAVHPARFNFRNLKKEH